MDVFAREGPSDTKSLDFENVYSAPLAPGLTAADKRMAEVSRLGESVFVYLATGNT